jgi:BMFP domain-containing protein YqiC
MNNPWDALLDNQKKVMEFWGRLASQTAPTPNETGKHSTKENDIFSEWMNQQKSFWEKWTQSAQSEDSVKAMPEQFRQWMEMQQRMTEQYAAMYKEQASKMGLNWPQPDLSVFMPNRIMEENFKQWKSWSQGGDKWMRNTLMAKMPYNMQPHYNNFVEFFDDLHRYWEPFSRMIQNGIFDKELVEKYFTRDAYLKTVNQLMGFKPVGNVTELIDYVNHYFERIMSQVGEEGSKWTAVSDNWREKMTDFISGSHVPMLQFGNDLNNRLRDQLTPFFNIAAQGRQTEVAKLLRDVQFGYISFILKTSELQSKVYDAGQYALPDVLRRYYETYQKNRETPDFQAFLHTYINELENRILEVLNADDYSMLQSEIAALGANLKQTSDRASELIWSDMPFITRSEGDDFAREAAAIRKKMRALEQRLEALENRPALSTESDLPTSKSKRAAVKP